MSLLSTLKGWFGRTSLPEQASAAPVRGPGSAHRAVPAVRFETVSIIPKALTRAEVKPDQFYVVAHADNAYWAQFRCPDGCGEVISLPLRAPHTPRWQVFTSAAGRATLKPSVWRNQGCKAHFFVNDGRVFWCIDSGRAPSQARPDLYHRG